MSRQLPVRRYSDKSQIFQVIRAIQSGERVYAALAPAFVGQFGPKVTPGKLRAAMKKLGFADVFEVAIGADLCAAQEAEDFVNEVPEKLPFMATSCCPAWSVMAKKLFPDYASCISMALTPMTLTARLIKKHNPNAKVVFVGPCAAKKLEAMRRSVRSEVDFVLTFEEMSGIFDARQVDVSALEEDPDGVSDASVDGRNFAVSGGVAKSVENVIREKYPDREIKMANAEGLKECRKLLTMAKAGKYNGYLLEGMACPGGCVAGAGTMQSIKKSQAAVNKYAAQAKHKNFQPDRICKRTGQTGRLKRTAGGEKSEKGKERWALRQRFLQWYFCLQDAARQRQSRRAAGQKAQDQKVQYQKVRRQRAAQRHRKQKMRHWSMCLH